MKKWITALIITMTGSLALAREPLSLRCQEKAANAIIDFLEDGEPDSDLHLIKNDKGQIIAIEDVEKLIGTLDFNSIYPNGDGTYTMMFNDGEYLAIAKVRVRSASGKNVCDILYASSGTADQL